MCVCVLYLWGVGGDHKLVNLSFPFLSCEGRNPMECRSIESYLSQPLSPSEEKENNLLRTLQGIETSLLGKPFFELHS